MQTLECNVIVIFHCPGSHLDYRMLYCLIPIFWFSSQGLRHAKTIPKAMPKQYRIDWNNIVPDALCPQKASLKPLYVQWCPQQAVCTWPALSKSPQYEPAIMNTENCNFISDLSITIIYIHAPKQLFLTKQRFNHEKRQCLFFSMSHMSSAMAPFNNARFSNDLPFRLPMVN